jgi:ribosome maturation factor RimP
LQLIYIFYEIEGTKVPSFIGIILDLRVEKIRGITKRYLPDSTYFVVDVKLSGKKGFEKVVVFVDGDKGLNIDICAAITKSLSNELDMMNLFEGNYTLEVSSPGIDYPLTSERQYHKNLGRQLRVDRKDGDILKCELLDTVESGITLLVEKGKKQEKKDVFIPYSDIKKSKVLVTFK